MPTRRTPSNSNGNRPHRASTRQQGTSAGREPRRPLSNDHNASSERRVSDYEIKKQQEQDFRREVDAVRIIRGRDAVTADNIRATRRRVEDTDPARPRSTSSSQNRGRKQTPPQSRVASSKPSTRSGTNTSRPSRRPRPTQADDSPIISTPLQATVPRTKRNKATSPLGRVTVQSSSAGNSSNREGAASNIGAVVGSILSTVLSVFVTVFSFIARAISAGVSALGSLLSSSHTARMAGLVICVVVVLGVADTAASWGKVYNGVKVGDVDLSGMTQEDATSALDRVYTERLSDSGVTIYADADSMSAGLAGKNLDDLESSEDVSIQEAAAAQKSWNTNAQTLQGRFDAGSLASSALEVGRSNGGFLTRIGAQLFGYVVAPYANWNEQAINTLASDVDTTLGDPRVNYDIAVDNGSAGVVDGHDGHMVDRSWLEERLNEEFLDKDSDHAFVAQIDYAPLQIDYDAASKVADEVNRAIEQGATFHFNDNSWSASQAELGSWVKTTSYTDNNGTHLVPYIDADAAKTTIVQNLKPDYHSESAVEFQKTDDGVKVTTAATGEMPLSLNAAQELNRLLFEEGRGSDTPYIEVEGTEIPSSMSLDEATDYGLVSVLSSYTTEYTANADARNTNIHLAAELLNNSIVEKDGGDWSFNGTAGECNEEKGFKGAGVIINGETVDEIGGGICQVATTVFNAVFDSGFPVTQRSNHSLYIASYPAGRDAAVSWPDLDLKWENDTANDVLVTTSYTDTTVTVTLIGVPTGYKVTSETGEFKQGAAYSTRTVQDATLTASQGYVKQVGSDGLSISVTRTVKGSDGQVLRTDTFDSVYDAKDEIIVEGTKTS